MKFLLPTGPRFSYTRKMLVPSIPVDEKRRGRPPGSNFASAIPVRLTPAQRGAVDAWIADQPDPKPSRSEAIRHLLGDVLTGLGYLPHRDDPEMAN